MLQTTNYQLNQWDPEDRILRTDFNSDNQKIDAALKSQADALANTSIFTPIKEVVLNEISRNLQITLEDVDWNQWHFVVMDAMLLTEDDGSATVRNSLTTDTYFGMATTNDIAKEESSWYGPSRLILFCNHDQRTTINSLSIEKGTTEFYNMGSKFQGLSSLYYISFGSTSDLQPGSKVQVWGVK